MTVDVKNYPVSPPQIVAVGHDGALPSKGLDHGRQERDPPDGDPEHRLALRRPGRRPCPGLP